MKWLKPAYLQFEHCGYNVSEYVNGVNITLQKHWTDVENVCVKEMFDKYKDLREVTDKDSYFERVLLPPFINAWYVCMCEYRRVPTPHGLFSMYMKLFCTQKDAEHFILKPSVDFRVPERHGVNLPQRPSMFENCELFVRIARVYPALYREMWLMDNLQLRNKEWKVKKNTQRDIHAKADLTVICGDKQVDLAIYDWTRRSVRRRSEKLSGENSKQVEVSFDPKIHMRELESGLIVYNQIGILKTEKLIQRELDK
jgi:hypothetical protein